MKALNITVRGKVQGVFFRAEAKEEASRLELCGYAKNINDGSVEIHAEGDKISLEHFLKWVESGPKNAHVKQVECKEARAENYKSFFIE